MPGDYDDPRSVRQLREHLAELRRTDLRNWRDAFAALELRLQQRFDAQESSVTTAMAAAEKAVTAALTASEKAVEKAEQAQAARNTVANEFRATIADTTATMWPAKEGAAAIKALGDATAVEITGLRRERTALYDSLDARVKAIEVSRAGSSGRQVGTEATWSNLHSMVLLGFGLIAAIAAVASIMALLR